MKKIFTLALIIFVSFSSIALAKNPVRIARLPIIIQNNHIDNETAAILETKMARAVKVPMNNTLKTYEYIPPREAGQALNNIWQEMYARNQKNLSDALKILANELDADLVICPLLKNYYQENVTRGLNFESRLLSHVSAELIIYDKNTDELIDKKASRSFNDQYHKFGTASYLAGECFDRLIKETDLRQIIRNKRG